MQVREREQIGQALKRFKRLLENHRKVEKWYRKPKWWGVYFKPSEIRRARKNSLKRLKARAETKRAKQAGKQ
jgi:ribosomal protein S21